MKENLSQAGQGGGLMNLTVSQVQYLEAIAIGEKATITSVAETLRVSKPSATTAVQRLIRLGYVARSRSEQDRRVHFLALTEAGKDLAQAKQRVVDEYEEHIRAALTPAELAGFENAIGKLVRHFNQTHTQE